MRTSLVGALIAAAVGADVAAAQEPSQVTGPAVRQGDGFATMSWAPVAGATDYQIERARTGTTEHRSPSRSPARRSVVEIGRTVQGRPINMLVIGYPEPPRSVKHVARDQRAGQLQRPRQRAVLARGCLILARELAFSRDRRTREILSEATVLLVPTINGDGRAANTRGKQTVVAQPPSRAMASRRVTSRVSPASVVSSPASISSASASAPRATCCSTSARACALESSSSSRRRRGRRPGVVAARQQLAQRPADRAGRRRLRAARRRRSPAARTRACARRTS